MKLKIDPKIWCQTRSQKGQSLQQGLCAQSLHLAPDLPACSAGVLGVLAGGAEPWMPQGVGLVRPNCGMSSPGDRSGRSSSSIR